MLHQFPVEIALQIISNLPLYSLCSAAVVSRRWHALMTANEPVVYKNAALLHRFIDEGGAADPTSTDWKAYCRRQLEIERGWRGKGSSTVQELTAAAPVTHRIKVDYGYDFVITTSQIGGLFVTNIKTDHTLWALPPLHAPPYIHVEYDHGYMVFNRHDSCKEVWRHSLDTDGEQHSETSPPDQQMLDMSSQAAAKFNSSGIRRGHFRAWGLLRLPEECRCFRVSYPNLLAVATNNAYCWDLPTMRLVSVIQGVRQRHQGVTSGPTAYAEVNDLYAFICGKKAVRIFARMGGALRYQLPLGELSGATIWDVVQPQTRTSVSSIVHPQTLRRSEQTSSSSYGSFMACHVSASGKDLAILTTNGRLVLLPHFQRLFSGPKTVHPQDIAITLNLQPLSNDEHASYYLAVGSRNGKLAAATKQGIYLISPDVDFTRLAADCPPQPGVYVCRLAQFEHKRALSFVSCLQITYDALYVTYGLPQEGVPAGMNTVHVVRF